MNHQQMLNDTNPPNQYINVHQDVAQSESIKTLESRGFFPQQPQRGAEKVQETTRMSKMISTSKTKGSTASFATQQYMLLQREKNSMIRNPAPMIANVGITALLALIFGVIFFGVGRDDRTDLLVRHIFFFVEFPVHAYTLPLNRTTH